MRSKRSWWTMVRLVWGREIRSSFTRFGGRTASRMSRCSSFGDGVVLGLRPFRPALTGDVLAVLQGGGTSLALLQCGPSRSCARRAALGDASEYDTHMSLTAEAEEKVCVSSCQPLPREW